jgi:hypothetical protein
MLKSVIHEFLPSEPLTKDSTHSKSSVVKETLTEPSSTSEQVDSVMEGIGKSLNLNTFPKSASSSHKRTNSILITHFSSNHKSSVKESNFQGPTARKRMGNNLVLDGKKLSALLSSRPELSEFLFMEIENMKLCVGNFE